MKKTTFILSLVICLNISASSAMTFENRKDVTSFLYKAYSFWLSPESSDAVEREKMNNLFLTQKCREQVRILSEQTNSDPLIHAQDVDSSAISTLEVLPIEKDIYRVCLTFNKNGENEKTSVIFLKVIKKKKQYKIDYVRPEYDSSLNDESISTTVRAFFGKSDADLNNYITTTLRYPQYAMKNRITGRVIVTFVVKADGTVCNPKILRGVAPCLDNEAIRLVELMPKWTPATNGSKKVNSRFTIPLSFK